MQNKTIRILGTRGVPAAHGGFETFAEHLALYLVQRGWAVTVYCQVEGSGPVFEDEWQGIRRVNIPVKTQGAAGTIIFDWKSTLHAAGTKELVLTLGYNTAVFCFLYRLRGITNLINMDGIEWHRQKWGKLAKLWFWLNDWAGSWLGNHLIADHPEIARHLETRVNVDKITTIPYGADQVAHPNIEHLQAYGLQPEQYAILIARAEPENSILEVVKAWSRKHRDCKLFVLGKYAPDHAYQAAVKAAGSDEVIFPGAIYDKAVVESLRFYSLFYIHGHQVGGTNPSLVEALAAGNAVLAHDNKFNRWVAGPSASYFVDEEDCSNKIESLLLNDALLQSMKQASQGRHQESFTWDAVLSEYEKLFVRFL
jgi:glycosyltransferase involved in cell wall biosynthesis